MDHITPIQAAVGGKLVFCFGQLSEEQIDYYHRSLSALFPGQEVVVVTNVSEVIYDHPGDSVHRYISTACQHHLHARCRLECKFCNVDCGCNCHLGVTDDHPAADAAPVPGAA